MNSIELFNTSIARAKHNKTVLGIINQYFTDRKQRYTIVSFVNGYEDLTKNNYNSDEAFITHLKTVSQTANLIIC